MNEAGMVGTGGIKTRKIDRIWENMQCDKEGQVSIKQLAFLGLAFPEKF